MATIVPNTKALSGNPLKSSAPLGAALAFLGMEGSVPLFHGSQGCTSFALVLAVRHFKEAIPLQTTAMNEVSTILGGADHVEEALINLKTRMKPRFIGIASTALVETRGEDFVGDLRLILERRKDDLAGTEIVFASTPDFNGALEDGWSKAVTAIIDKLVPKVDALPVPNRQINILAGVHQTPGDIDALRDLCAAFGLEAVVLPDISGSLDGHVPEAYSPTTMGGTSLAQIANLHQACHCIAIGEHMREPALLLHARTGVKTTLFPNLLGLDSNDKLVRILAEVSGQTVPTSIKRRRSQLVDAMLDGHFHFSGKRLAIAADPDLLFALTNACAGLGAEIVTAVASTANSPLLDRIPADQVVIGDLTDLEDRAKAAGAEILITHSHGRLAAERLGIPLLRMGFPIFDRLGAPDRVTVGYGGTRAFIYEFANLVQAAAHAHQPADFDSAYPAGAIVEETRNVGQNARTH